GFERLLAFDHCGLILPESDGRGIRVWQASRRGRGPTEAAFEQSDALFARVLHEGSSRLMNESDLPGFGREVKSALALPLTVGGVCFGVLCFASAEADAFAKEDTDRLAWLADVVASAAQVILLRARLDVANENLREMDRLKSGFVNTLVRDIRLPLTSVLGLL